MKTLMTIDAPFLLPRTYTTANNMPRKKKEISFSDVQDSPPDITCRRSGSSEDHAGAERTVASAVSQKAVKISFSALPASDSPRVKISQTDEPVQQPKFHIASDSHDRDDFITDQKHPHRKIDPRPIAVTRAWDDPDAFAAMRQQTDFIAFNNEPSKWRMVLHFFKDYFLVFHFCYILSVALIAAGLMKLNSGTDIRFIDALFMATSGVTCSGLSTVSPSDWNVKTNIALYSAIVLGGVVFTSIVPCLLRIATLKQIQHSERDTLSGIKKKHVARLLTTSKIMAFAVLTYWMFAHIVCVLVLLPAYNISNAIILAISNFNNFGWLEKGFGTTNTHAMITFTVFVPAGQALVPLFLRLWLMLLQRLYWVIQKVKKCFLRSSTEPDRQISSQSVVVSTMSILSSNPSFDATTLDTGLQNDSMILLPAQRPELRKKSEIELGFDLILNSRSPLNHHPMLFTMADTVYVLVVWILVVLLQVIPTLIQQWSDGYYPGALAQFDDQGPAKKVWIAIAQAILVRFSGHMLYNFNYNSAPFLFGLCFVLFLAPLPVPGDRTSRKWKMLFSGGIYCVVGEKMWWLFLATLTILYIEAGLADYTGPGQINPQIDTNHSQLEFHFRPHGAVIRTMIEVVSAYATSGVSLTMVSSQQSLSASFTDVSKLIIILCMLAGRHRGMDLGLDIGLTNLSKGDTSTPEGLELIVGTERRWAAEGDTVGDAHTT